MASLAILLNSSNFFNVFYKVKLKILVLYRQIFKLFTYNVRITFYVRWILMDEYNANSKHAYNMWKFAVNIYPARALPAEAMFWMKEIKISLSNKTITTPCNFLLPLFKCGQLVFFSWLKIISTLIWKRLESDFTVF